MKVVQQEKDKLEEKQRKSAIGERYDKERLKNLKAPSFLTRKEEQDK